MMRIAGIADTYPNLVIPANAGISFFSARY